MISKQQDQVARNRRGGTATSHGGPGLISPRTPTHAPRLGLHGYPVTCMWHVTLGVSMGTYLHVCLTGMFWALNAEPQWEFRWVRRNQIELEQTTQWHRRAFDKIDYTRLTIELNWTTCPLNAMALDYVESISFIVSRSITFILIRIQQLLLIILIIILIAIHIYETQHQEITIVRDQNYPLPASFFSRLALVYFWMNRNQWTTVRTSENHTYLTCCGLQWIPNFLEVHESRVRVACKVVDCVQVPYREVSGQQNKIK